MSSACVCHLENEICWFCGFKVAKMRVEELEKEIEGYDGIAIQLEITKKEFEEKQKAWLSAYDAMNHTINELKEENKLMKSVIEVDRHEYSDLFRRYQNKKEEIECLQDELMIAKGEV